MGSGSYVYQVLLVGLGGFVGSSARFVLSGWVHRALPFATMPYGTMAVNIIGCLAIGFMAGIVETRHALGPSQRIFLMVGVLGGFTTFSTFSYETLELTRDSEFVRAFANVGLQVILGFAAAAVGHNFAR